MASPEGHHWLWVAQRGNLWVALHTSGCRTAARLAPGGWVAAARPAQSRQRPQLCQPPQLCLPPPQVLCFLGSLFEPFDTVLPAKHPLRFFVDQVQHARRAFEVKHGLEGLRTPMSFFDEADDDEGGDGEDDEDGGDGDGDAVDAAEAAEAGEEAQGVAAAESADQESSEE